MIALQVGETLDDQEASCNFLSMEHLSYSRELASASGVNTTAPLIPKT